MGSVQKCSSGKNHHWIIEPHTLPQSCGTCKYCGATKSFNNEPPVINWFDPGLSFPNVQERPPRTKAEEIDLFVGQLIKEQAKSRK